MPIKATEPPVILYPMHGCEALGMLNEKQATAAMKKARESLRSNWNQDGVKALVELIEQRGARLQRAAIAPGGTAHEQGQAYAMSELLSILHGILVSEESPGG